MRWWKRILGAGLVAGAAYAVWRALDEESRRSPIEWQPQPFPSPPMPVPRERVEAWVEPVDGACPGSHPIKAKLTSGIFHAPGGQMYDRTVADRCYCDTAAAEADGLRPSKR